MVVAVAMVAECRLAARVGVRVRLQWCLVEWLVCVTVVRARGKILYSPAFTLPRRRAVLSSSQRYLFRFVHLSFFAARLVRCSRCWWPATPAGPFLAEFLRCVRGSAPFRRYLHVCARVRPFCSLPSRLFRQRRFCPSLFLTSFRALDGTRFCVLLSRGLFRQCPFVWCVFRRQVVTPFRRPVHPRRHLGCSSLWGCSRSGRNVS